MQKGETAEVSECGEEILYLEGFPEYEIPSTWTHISGQWRVGSRGHEMIPKPDSIRVEP